MFTLPFHRPGGLYVQFHTTDYFADNTIFYYSWEKAMMKYRMLSWPLFSQNLRMEEAVV